MATTTLFSSQLVFMVELMQIWMKIYMKYIDLWRLFYEYEYSKEISFEHKWQSNHDSIFFRHLNCN